MTKERPILNGLVNKGTSEIEQFQNKTLRPVIKMQHELLIGAFKNYLQKRKIDFPALTEEKRRSRIASIFKTDNNYKNFTLGIIISHFSVAEFEFYKSNSSEINRRILQIITKRIQDSIKEILL